MYHFFKADEVWKTDVLSKDTTIAHKEPWGWRAFSALAWILTLMGQARPRCADTTLIGTLDQGQRAGI
jgi:hypothetical protein